MGTTAGILTPNLSGTYDDALFTQQALKLKTVEERVLRSSIISLVLGVKVGKAGEPRYS